MEKIRKKRGLSNLTKEHCNEVHNGFSQDLYTTQAKDIEPVIPYLNLLEEQLLRKPTIFDPCAGLRAFGDTFRKHGFSDIIERDLFTLPEKHNFLTDTPPDDFDLIATNPPFNRKYEFIERCFELKKPVILLLPFESLLLVRTRELFIKHGLVVFVLRRQPLFLKNGEGKGTASSHASYFLFGWGFNKPNEIRIEYET